MATKEQKVRVDLAPRWIVRENTYSYRALRHEAGSQAESLLRRIHEQLVLRSSRRIATVGELEAVIPQLEGRARNQALAAKRAVYNAAATLPTIEADVFDVAPLLREWARSLALSTEMAAAVDELECQDEASERAILSEWANDAYVQQSVAMTSTVLLHALRARARGGKPDKRGRKSEAALVQYFSRSTLRVSPFSRYTAIDLRVFGETESSSGGELTSFVAIKRLLVRHAVRRATAEPENAEHVLWAVPSGARFENGSLRFRRRDWMAPATGARMDAFHENDVVWPVPETWRAVLSALLIAPPGRLRELAGRLTQASPHLREGMLAGLGKLVGRGILVPVPLVSEQDSDYESKMLAALRPWPGRHARSVVDALQTTAALTREFGELGASDRTQRLEVLERKWSIATGTKVRAPIAEDSYRTASSKVPPPERWLEPIQTLAPMLAVLDDQRLLSVALEATFVAEYGEGGTCRDIRGFARNAAASFPLAQRLLAGDEDSAPTGVVQRLLRARAIAVGHLRAISQDDGPEVSIDREFLERLAGFVSDEEQHRRRTVAVFGQVAAERFVINHLYGGRLRYFSRYLQHHDGEHLLALRSHLKHQVGEALTLQMRPTLGFNANLSPLLTDAELVLDDDVPHADTTRHVEDLSIVHRPDGLQLVEHASGRAVEMVYAGFLVPHALPSTEMLLAMMAEAPFYGFGDLSIDLHRRGVGAHTPRIVHEGLVLFRRRWALDLQDLERRPDESSSAHFRRLDSDRRRAGMPSQVFLHALRGDRVTPMERALSPKPQHHDFLSRLHASTVRRRLQNLGPTVVAEELLPEPNDGGFAAEVFFEATIGGNRE